MELLKYRMVLDIKKNILTHYNNRKTVKHYSGISFWTGLRGNEDGHERGKGFGDQAECLCGQ